MVRQRSALSRLDALDLDDPEDQHRRQQPVPGAPPQLRQRPLVGPGQQPEPHPLARVGQHRLEAVPVGEGGAALLGQIPARQLAQAELPLDPRPARLALAVERGLRFPQLRRRESPTVGCWIRPAMTA